MSLPVAESLCDFYPFGEEINASGASNEYKFTGKVGVTMKSGHRSRLSGKWDSESALYYSWHRYYSPTLGRFTQVDPMWMEYPGLTSYQYCDNNPLKFIDKNGKELKPANERSQQRHNTALKLSPRYTTLVDRINTILKEDYNNLDIPLNTDVTQSQVTEASQSKEGSSNGVMVPGVNKNEVGLNTWVVEGTEVLVSNEISTSDLKNTSTYETMGHELTHLLDFLLDPKAFLKDVINQMGIPHDDKTYEKHADEEAKKINGEIYGQ